MSPNDDSSSNANSPPDEADGATDPGGFSLPGRDRLEQGADRAIEGFDKRLVDLVAWLLDTETRARIYIFLRQSPGSTSDEIATGTGLYPSTVREALVELFDEGVVTREKRASEGAGNNPYEYDAIPPSELVNMLAAQVQEELNTLFSLDEYLEPGRTDPAGSEAVRITVEDPDLREGASTQD